jgi:hypothetical protein
LCISWRFLEE